MTQVKPNVFRGFSTWFWLLSSASIAVFGFIYLLHMGAADAEEISPAQLLYESPCVKESVLRQSHETTRRDPWTVRDVRHVQIVCEMRGALERLKPEARLTRLETQLQAARSR